MHKKVKVETYSQQITATVAFVWGALKVFKLILPTILFHLFSPQFLPHNRNPI